MMKQCRYKCHIIKMRNFAADCEMFIKNLSIDAVARKIISFTLEMKRDYAIKTRYFRCNVQQYITDKTMMNFYVFKAFANVPKYTLGIIWQFNIFPR